MSELNRQGGTIEAPPGESIEETELGHRVAREFDILGERRELRIAGIKIEGRRRRPSGEAAPLERELKTSGKIWLLLAVTVAITWISLFALPSTTEWWTQRDNEVLSWFVDIRTNTATTVARAIDFLSSSAFVRVVRIATLLGLIFVRRWRHFFAVVLAILIVQATTEMVRGAVGRPRPFVPILGTWDGPSHPSAPIAGLGVTLGVMAFALLPSGRRRQIFLVVSGALVLIVGVARMYLGVDHPTDFVVSALLGPAVAVIVFSLFAPEATFPVTWKRGVTAHLDVSGRRGGAIKRAVKEQLGLEVLEIKPFGLEGSGGSTPLRLRIAGDADDYVFAKLYSQTHLRSDRWYKLGRSILYGSLEDEVRFTTVRRLVEYEDYIQRLMRDSDIPSAEPIGLVEITPDREYLMVSQFLEGAVEFTDAEVTEAIIDDALGVIRALWDAGLAHRDIKPANVMVRDGRVVLIDVAFGTVRPSPWRQAVDLANMMVILGLRSNAEHVYERALRQFAHGDIAEAFAATRSLTLPSQSRSSLAVLKREEGIDLVEEFRRLAPAEPISIQRWSPRRALLATTALLVSLLLLSIIFSEVTGTGFL